MTLITTTTLNTYVTSNMADIIADKQLITRGHQMTFQFVNLLASTPEKSRQRRFVVPRSCFIETVFAYGYEPFTTETITVNITGDGALINWPIDMSEAYNGSRNFSRTWFNNASTKYRDRGFRVLPQGSTVTLTVSSTLSSVGASNSFLTVGLVLRQFYGR